MNSSKRHSRRRRSYLEERIERKAGDNELFGTDDWLLLVEKVQKAGLKAKPELGIQFGAGGATATAELEAEGTRDPEWAISQAKRFVDAGAYMIMIESEGITENVKTWRTDVVAKIINALRLDVRCDFPSSV